MDANNVFGSTLKKETLAALSRLKRLRQKKITWFFYYQSKTVKYCQTLLNSFENLVTALLLEDYNAPFTKTKHFTTNYL